MVANKSLTLAAKYQFSPRESRGDDDDTYHRSAINPKLKSGFWLLGGKMGECLLSCIRAISSLLARSLARLLVSSLLCSQ